MYPIRGSISRKLTWMNMLVSGAALLVAGMALFAYDLFTFRDDVVRNLSAAAQIVGANSGSAIVFNDAGSAVNTLSALNSSPHITFAAIYTPDGQSFASIARNPAAEVTSSLVLPVDADEAHSFSADQVELVRRIVLEGKPIGTVYIRSDLQALNERLKRYAEIVAVVLVISLLAALLISSIMRRSLSAPLVHLAELAHVISRDKNYAVRATLPNQHAELAVLTEAFNEMLEQIQTDERAIKIAKDELERRVEERTAQLAAANKELESFSYSVSHDLRAPLRHIDGFSSVLASKCEASMDTEAKHYLKRIRDSARHMGLLIDDLLNMGRIGRQDVVRRTTDTNLLVQGVIQDLQSECEGRSVEWKIEDLPVLECDPGLMKMAFTNLISNAVKYSRNVKQATIEIGMIPNGNTTLFIRDNGAGFDQQYAHKLFGVFQRLHREEEFEGTGVGLATVERIIRKHGGRIWAEGAVGKGATFFFTLEVEHEQAGG